MRTLSTLVLALPLLAPITAGAPVAPAAPMPASPAFTFDEVDDLIERGRAKLLERDARGALAAFDEAARLEPGLRTGTWVLRARMEAGTLNDILGEIDALDRKHDGPEIDYLYGMAFAIKAQAAIDAGLTDGTIGMQLTDAQTYLASALDGTGARFSDAWPVLSKVAWMNQDLDAALAASDEAVAFYPKGAATLVQRGRIQLSRYIAANDGDPARNEERAAIAEDGIDAFEKGLRAMGKDKDDGRVAERADAWKQLAYLHGYAGQHDEASTAYAESMAWDPTAHDYGALWGSLGERFIPTLTDGKQRFVERWGTETASDATLLWYLGYARLAQADEANYEVGEEELLASVAKFPAYANAYYYVCHLRYNRGDFVGAGDALLLYWEADRNGAVATVGGDLAVSRAKLDYVVGKVVQAGRLVEAADISELLAHAAPPGHLDWNNRGLFLRDHGDLMLRRDRKVKWGNEKLMVFYEKSLEAYERALAGDPENPNYMNDLAVVLHYNLRRDYERALELYDRAEELAARMMEDPEIPEKRKTEWISIALRDSANNARELRRQLKKLEEEKEGAGS